MWIINISFDQSTELNQQLTGAQLQSLTVLAMDTTELNAFLQQEYLENPLLDYQPAKEYLFREQTLESAYERQRPAIGQENNPDTDTPRTAVPAPDLNRIRDSLLWQLDRTRCSDHKWELMGHLIDCMDDNGYFQIPVEQIALSEGVSIEEIVACLAELRELEPYGIMAADLRACLLKQLETKGLRDSVVWKIVEGYLQQAAAGKLSVISRGLSMTTAQVRGCLEQIRALNPRPLMSAEGEDDFVMPDVILTLEQEMWRIDLNDGWLENYRMNDYYYAMMKDTQDEQLREYFKSKLDRVRFIQQSIEQRINTIHQIVKRIATCQDAFLRKKQALAPMTLQEMAQQIGVHPSTVGRAIRGKYLQYPGGVVLMKALFSKGLDQPQQGKFGVTAMQIKQQIRQLVESEDTQKPLSDQKLMEQMAREGLYVSRRVVAKYREEIGIRGSYLRKTE